MSEICLDRNRYVIAVVNWKGEISLRKRRLKDQDAAILYAWLANRVGTADE